MAKKSGNKSSSSIFVTSIDVQLAEKLIADLKQQDFEMSTPQYTVFSAKKKGVSCTLYQSGKLTVQGKEMKAFVEFYLEPEILKSFTFTYGEVITEEDENAIDQTGRIGIDESGKGDFFGPLCVAGVYAKGPEILKLKTLGVRDSKLISDSEIIVIGNKIRNYCAHHIVKINPAKYNDLYEEFKNLNSLLAWGHATTIENLVARTGCHDVVVDQFAAEWVVKTALKRKKIEVNLTQRHKAEEDLVVAAASILARQTFLEGLKQLGEQYLFELPKGASAKVIDMGRQFVIKYGKDMLRQVGKIHFKTIDSILK